MLDKIRAGTILIAEGTVLPDSLQVDSESYSDGWTLVKDLDGYGLDRRIRGMGWTCFYMANQIKASAFALSPEKSLRRAVNRILTDPKLDGFNSLEITQVMAQRFLGLAHTTVSAHARHIQESVFLFDWMRKEQRQQLPASSDEKRVFV
jgi:hypothetical protein